MNCSPDIKPHLKAIQLELELTKKLRNTEAALRKNAELQLRQVRGELQKLEAERLVLIQQLGQYQKRVEELEVELFEKNNLTEMKTGSGKEPLIITLDDDNEDTERDILEMVSNMAKYMTATSSGQTVKQSSKTSSMIENPNHDALSLAGVGNNILGTKQERATARSTEVTPVEPPKNLSNANSSKPVSSPETFSTFQTAPVQQKAHGLASAISAQKIRKRFIPSKESTQKSTCHFCGVQKEKMKLHVRLCHRDPISSWWWCTYCPKRFINSSSLKLHYQADHCNVRYSCGVCNFSYKAASSLKRHVENSHGRGKPTHSLTAIHG